MVKGLSSKLTGHMNTDNKIKDTHELAMHNWKDNKHEHQSDQIRIPNLTLT